VSKKDPETDSRRERFRDYCRSRGWDTSSGNRPGWAVTAISQATGKPTNKISDLLNGNGSFGATIARELEDKLGLSKGFFDGAGNENFAEVARIDARLAAGNGAVEGYVDTIGALQFRRDFLRGCGISDPEKARVCNVKGHSMDPTVPDGAVVLINTSITQPQSGKIFALAKSIDGLVIKRLVKSGDDWLARSDNPDGNPDFQINDGESVDIIGRAVWVGAKL
jgi:phage repressor protein C with HTH and peptisase S24 domain